MRRNLGDTIWVDFEIRDRSGEALDEFTCHVILYDPHGNIRDTNANPTRRGRGVYEARLKIPASGREGVWKVKVIITQDGSEENEPLTFYVNP